MVSSCRWNRDVVVVSSCSWKRNLDFVGCFTSIRNLIVSSRSMTLDLLGAGSCSFDCNVTCLQFFLQLYTILVS